MKHLFLIVLIFVFSVITSAQTVYVQQGGTGTGTSWNDARGDLAAALASATNGTEIWVATGTYYPVNCSSCTLTDRNNYFEIPDGVKVYGGFSGDETSLDERDWTANPTILSGDIDKNGVLDSLNCFTVVYTENVSAATLVDGFIIEFGYSGQHDSYHNEEKNGGGWYNEGSHTGNMSNPTIANCIFQHNYTVKYGGGMYNNGQYDGQASPVFDNCQFIDNISDFDGSALFNDATFGGASSITATGCTFESNSCHADGTVFNQGSEDGVSSPVFSDCTFTGNTVDGNGGAVYSSGKSGNSNPLFSHCVFQSNHAAQGGAVFNNGNYADSHCNPVFETCDFFNNNAGNSGGAIFSIGYHDGNCQPEMRNCTFQGNNADGSGGAIFNSGQYGYCKPLVYNCKFFENTASSYGAAMYNMGKGGDCSPKVVNCLIANNSATVSCGGIYNLGSAGGRSNTEVINCTFYHNTAQVCGAFYANAGDSTGTCNPVVTNSIFYANDGSSVGKIFKMVYGNITLSHCSLDVGTCGEAYDDGNNNGSLTCGEGVLYDINPQFVDVGADDYHLLDGSPVINAGTNDVLAGIDVDLDNLPRIMEMTVDMGVYESGQDYVTPSITQQPQSVDVCEGTSVTFSVTAEGTGVLSYQWQKDGIDLNGETNNVLSFTQANIGDAGVYTCVVEDNFGGTVTSEAALLEIQEKLHPSVEITTPNTHICEATGVIITAILQDTGDNPTITWYKNGEELSSSETSISFYNLPDGTSVYCQVGIAEGCTDANTVTSNTVVFEVMDSYLPAVEIESDTVVCEGDSAVLTAVPTHGGDSPQYQWQLNGENTGDGGNILTVPLPEDGDEIVCTLTSSLECAVPSTATSDPVTLHVSETVVASITIASVEDTVCRNEPVDFVSTCINAGDEPVFQWYVNGVTTGGNSPELTVDSLHAGDVVTCLMTSEAACVETASVLSNEVTVFVDTCTDVHNHHWDDAAVKIYPNPARDKVKIVLKNASSGNLTLELFNTTGQRLYFDIIPLRTDEFMQQIDISSYPKGVYYLKLSATNGLIIKKIIKT